MSNNADSISPVLFEALCRLSGRSKNGHTVDVISIYIDVQHNNRRKAVRVTAREREVLQLSSYGLDVVDIAAKMGISKQAVYNKQHRLYKKLGVRNRTEAVACALRKKLIN